MPELPEVETVRRGLQPVMEGAHIAAVEQRLERVGEDALLVPPAGGLLALTEQ
jgi:formamidopyrimidine-DNA glycosylase